MSKEFILRKSNTGRTIISSPEIKNVEFTSPNNDYNKLAFFLTELDFGKTIVIKEVEKCVECDNYTDGSMFCNQCIEKGKKYAKEIEKMKKEETTEQELACQILNLLNVNKNYFDNPNSKIYYDARNENALRLAKFILKRGE